MIGGGVLAQLDQLTPQQRAVRDHFQEGGSLTAVLLVILGFILLMIFAYGVFVWSRRKAKPELKHSAPATFLDALLEALALPESQAELVHQIVDVAQVKEPAKLLLVEKLFDDSSRKLLRHRAQHGGEASLESATKRLAELKSFLFPKVAGRIGTPLAPRAAE